MFDHLREDFDRHGRTLRNRALWALAVYRFGRWVATLPQPLHWIGGKIYGLLQVLAPIITGVALDRRTVVGKRFHIVHPGMVLIHPDARIGDRVGVMHGVTLGVGNKPGSNGVPTLRDDVFIGAHATLLGPITIGAGASVAANTLVICDVPPGGFAIGVPAKIYPAGSPAALSARPKPDGQPLNPPQHQT